MNKIFFSIIIFSTTMIFAAPNVKELDERAKKSHAKKDYLEEIRALELIKIEGKPTPNQLYRLAQAYSEINKQTEAVTNFREALKVAPKYDKAYRGLYDFYIKNKNFYDARLIVMEAIDRLGLKKEWLNELCRMEIEQQYLDSAKEVCQKAIMNDPKRADNHVYLATAFKFTENEDQARKILFKAAKQFKNSELTQWSAGQMSQAIQNWELATEHYTQCVKADKTSGRCYLELGKVQFQLKNYDKAFVVLKKACPYIKGADADIRRLSYELEKISQMKQAKKYLAETDKCELAWFTQSKKSKK